MRRLFSKLIPLVFPPAAAPSPCPSPARGEGTITARDCPFPLSLDGRGWREAPGEGEAPAGGNIGVIRSGSGAGPFCPLFTVSLPMGKPRPRAAPPPQAPLKGEGVVRRAGIRLGLAMAACLGATLVCGAAHAACQGQIVTGTSITGKTQYDPFNAAGINDQYAISIVNSGAQSCVFALAFTANSTPAKLGATLSYTLTNQGGMPVLSALASSGSPPPAGLQSPAINVNGKHDFPFSVVIEPGRFAQPGTYTDLINVSAQLYSIENGSYTLLQTAPVSISYKVQEAFSVNIAGGGLATTVDFGALAANAQRLVMIQARSNLRYNLAVASDNKGVLVLTPPVAGHNWSVPYTAALDGQSLNLSGAALTQTITPTTIAGDNHTLAVTIGDTSKKRAGIYKDVITVEINAVP